eukprot:scaffold55322_cov42-Prasinocladus_malaysianus.AAC.1
MGLRPRLMSGLCAEAAGLVGFASKRRAKASPCSAATRPRKGQRSSAEPNGSIMKKRDLS